LPSPQFWHGHSGRKIWWRLGRADDPLAFGPRDHCPWDGRWDDPERSFRTLYAAADRLTALKVVDLRGEDRGWVERWFTETLDTFDIERLATTDITDHRRRPFTQALSRAFYTYPHETVAGVVYPSNVDAPACLAIFEGRGRLQRLGEPVPVTPQIKKAPRLYNELNLALVESEEEDNTRTLPRR
jgi:hypothetical protein